MGKGWKGDSIGEERVVGVTGEGATAGIILAEDITVELPCVFGNEVAWLAVRSTDKRWRDRGLPLVVSR